MKAGQRSIYNDSTYERDKEAGETFLLDKSGFSVFLGLKEKTMLPCKQETRERRTDPGKLPVGFDDNEPWMKN